MDAICQELGIPRKQIKDTRIDNRFIVAAHKSWLKCLAQQRKLLDFPLYSGADEWPVGGRYTNPAWTNVYFCIYKKSNRKVIPLPCVREDSSLSNGNPMYFSQLLQYISQTNHQSLWKYAYKKYSTTKGKFSDQTKKSEKSSLNLVPHDSVLKEIIVRMYNCAVVHAQHDKLKPGNTADCENLIDIQTSSLECHANLYPVLAAIETTSHFILVFSGFLENNLMDCVTYSPAIISKSYNKPLFLIYQLLQLMRSLHKSGLVLGNVRLIDIYLTENLWLFVMPQLDSNILDLDSGESGKHDDVTIKQKNFNYSVRDSFTFTLKDYCEMWCHGQLANFDYLTIINNLSGRRLGCPGYHHIMPWITDFTARNGTNWRDFKKSKYRLNKGDALLDLMFSPSNENHIPHHVSDVLSEITYYVYKARRTPRSLLCKNVRPIWVPGEYPISIQRLQEWTPDECIPEFFTDPLIFKSIHEDLPDLEIPAWASCPEDFITKHREALESQHVSERLHHWIDLNFGYKLTGSAAIKAKNVCLSLVNDHQTLCERGIVQLFTHPHPPRQYPNAWTGKAPPRLYSQIESKRRLTRSSEDLSNYSVSEYDLQHIPSMQESQSSSPLHITSSSPKFRHKSPSSTSDDSFSNIERSTSLHSNVQKSQNQIFLPKEYNPIGALNAVENIEIFLSKTFYPNASNHTPLPSENIDLNLPNSMSAAFKEDGDNAFTNRIFMETYEASLMMKDTKRLHNLKYKNQIVQNTSRLYKHAMVENQTRELLIIGCITIEIFLPMQLRPLGSYAMQTFDERLDASLTLLNYEYDRIPKCVQYPIKLLLSGKSNLTENGLPQPNPHQLLQPLLSNILFPFPLSFTSVYTMLKTLVQFEQANNLLKLYTFTNCDGKNCSLYEQLDRTRSYLSRKIAECKVKSFAAQCESVLQPIGYEQFNHIEIILPHITDMLRNDETSVLGAWYLFDNIALALGPKLIIKHLLEPILNLYAKDNEPFLNSSSGSDAAQKSLNSPLYRSRKTIRIYHHSFLLRLIVRFGLKIFLDNFISPIIEAVGGCRDFEDNTQQQRFHYHNEDNSQSDKTNQSTKHLKYSKNDSKFLLIDDAAEVETNSVDKDTDKKEIDEMFTFECDADSIGGGASVNLEENSDNDVDAAILKIIDNCDLSAAGSLIDLRLNSSAAEEAMEFSAEQSIPLSADAKGPTSPIIPIPTFRRSTELNTIDCEIGSKKSYDSNDFLNQQSTEQMDTEIDAENSATTTKNTESRRESQQNRIAEISAESLIWLSHRLGPVLTAKYISRNLLKMLTLCYVGQENLLPNPCDNLKDNLISFTMSNGRVAGDGNSTKVLECLASISALFGDHFILLQYFPHASELIALCKKRITPTLEGGLIGSVQLLKCLVPCLSDAVIMNQLHDVILTNIIHPIIRLLASSRFQMPNGFLSRSVLARKLLDVLYVLAVRIGPEMTKEHLCIPALQRFFLIFDKAYGINDHFKNDEMDLSPPNSSDDSNYFDYMREWRTKDSPLLIDSIKRKLDTSANSITSGSIINSINTSADRIKDEIYDVFTPNLAHVAYLAFLKYLGEQVMSQFIKNLPLILNLCHEYEQPSCSTPDRKQDTTSDHARSINTMSKDTDSIDSAYSNSFGSAVIGNRLEVQKQENEMGAMELLDIVAYKYDEINTIRHLRGNWLAYWEHEIGRSDKNPHFNLKQIKLQTYAGHSNSVRCLLCLDNENSFMSASKDKTVKLWSLRSEGDGSKVSFCQFSYTNHRKSVHSLAFLESLRLTISCDSGVHLWDPFVGAQVCQLDSHKLTPVSVVKTYPAPSPLVLAGTAESTLKIIDGRTFCYVNEWKVSPGSSGSVRCIAVSPQGAWIAVGLSSGQLTLFDSRTGLIIASWKATDGELLQLSAPNEQQIISTSLDHNICVWSSLDGSLLFHLKNPSEPTHCILSNGGELLFGTPSNRIGTYSIIGPDVPYSITKLRSETFRGVVTSLALLPLNQMLLIGGDSGNINLLC